MTKYTQEQSQTKTCTKCGVEKPLGEYHRDRNSKDGLRYVCKTCSAEQGRAYHAANREKHAETVRAWSEANRERRAETNRAYRVANQERIAERQRAWARANPDKVAEYAVRARAKYPARYAARYAVNNAVRYGKLAAPRDLPCAACGEPAQEYHHHLGYTPEHQLDVIPVCTTCHTELHKEDS